MATVTGLTADRMLEIEAASVVDGDIVDGHLILSKHDGTTVDAGSVIGPVGPPGPVGSALAILTERQIYDVGVIDQIRAGRELTMDDFMNIGLSEPIGLWNLSNLDDVSGNNRDLNEKGAVNSIEGINGLANTAKRFIGSTGEALYIPDVGTNDPFRIRTGSVGAWVKSAKQGAYQSIITKRGAAGFYGYWLRFRSDNTMGFGVSSNGTAYDEMVSLSKLCDDRWHFVVGTFDGSLQKLYIDAVLEASALRAYSIYGTSSPFNIGAYGADVSAAAGEPLIGRIDEAFVTSEILNEDMIHSLYCAKIPHTLGEEPSRAVLNIRRCCKGASLLSGDFPVAPLRLYNFSAASLANEGTDGATGNLGNTGGALGVAGVDGTLNNAFNFSGTQRLSGTDAGLPDLLESVSYGCWFKTSNGTATMYILTYGATQGSNDNRIYIEGGLIKFATGSGISVGPFIADGNWHHVIVVQDNGADDAKRKFYLDGRLILTATTLPSVTLGGTGKFVIGSSLTSTNNFIGQIDTVFVTDIPLTMAQIMKVYAKCLHTQLASPKNLGDHIDSLSDEYLLVTFDTLESVHKVDLQVLA